MVGGLHVTLEDNQPDVAMLTSVESEGFPKFSDTIQRDPGNILSFDHGVEQEFTEALVIAETEFLRARLFGYGKDGSAVHARKKFRTERS